MKRTRLSDFEKTLLNSPECLLWPSCGCFKNLAHWQEALQDHDRTFTLEQLEDAADLLFYTCACVATHCPDPTIKAYCARQWANLTQRRQRIEQEQKRSGAN
jgi:hypothetical protein